MRSLVLRPGSKKSLKDFDKTQYPLTPDSVAAGPRLIAIGFCAFYSVSKPKMAGMAT